MVHKVKNGLKLLSTGGPISLWGSHKWMDSGQWGWRASQVALVIRIYLPMQDMQETGV